MIIFRISNNISAVCAVWNTFKFHISHVVEFQSHMCHMLQVEVRPLSLLEQPWIWALHLFPANTVDAVLFLAKNLNRKIKHASFISSSLRISSCCHKLE